MRQRLAGDRCGACDVFVGRVGARTDQRRGQFERPAVELGLGADLGHRTGQIGSVGPIDEWPQRRQVDFDDLVEVLRRIGEHVVIGAEVLGNLVGFVGDAFAAGGFEVTAHRVVVGEQRSGGADLGTHVADSGLARAADAVRAGTEVFDDGSGAALDGEDLGHFEDDVLGRRPSIERTREMYADQLWPPHIEGETGHEHAKAARVGRVRVGADHHTAGERVVLQHDLMDDAASRLPEADAVLRRDRAQEVVDLAVGVFGDREIVRGVDACGDQVVAVHRRRDSHLGQAGRHELQQGHLRRGVLHRDAIGTQVGVGTAPFDLLVLGIVEVVDQNLLGERQGTTEAPPTDRHPVGQGAVNAANEVDGCAGLDWHEKSSSTDWGWVPVSAPQVLYDTSI